MYYIRYMNTLTAINNYPLDYADSNDPVELDRGVRSAIRGVGLSILTISLTLARIKSEKLFLDLGWKNMTAYIEGLSKDTKSDRGNVFSWLKIGETYIKHRDELEKIGFSSGDSPTKLPYLERALENAPKEEVYNKLMTMSVRDFKKFAKSGKEKSVEAPPFWEIRGNILYIEGKRAIILNTNLGSSTTNMLLSAIGAACRALERKGYLVAVHLKTWKEVELFEHPARRIRSMIQRR